MEFGADNGAYQACSYFVRDTIARGSPGRPLIDPLGGGSA
jgi:hypothetical protein